MFEKRELLGLLNENCANIYNCNIDEITEKQLYKVVCTTIKNILAKK